LQLLALNYMNKACMAQSALNLCMLLLCVLCRTPFVYVLETCQAAILTAAQRGRLPMPSALERLAALRRVRGKPDLQLAFEVGAQVLFAGVLSDGTLTLRAWGMGSDTTHVRALCASCTLRWYCAVIRTVSNKKPKQFNGSAVHQPQDWLLPFVPAAPVQAALGYAGAIQLCLKLDACQLEALGAGLRVLDNALDSEYLIEGLAPAGHGRRQGKAGTKWLAEQRRDLQGHVSRGHPTRGRWAGRCLLLLLAHAL
jgi:hypothetical protein